MDYLLAIAIFQSKPHLPPQATALRTRPASRGLPIFNPTRPVAGSKAIGRKPDHSPRPQGGLYEHYGYVTRLEVRTSAGSLRPARLECIRGGATEQRVWSRRTLFEPDALRRLRLLHSGIPARRPGPATPSDIRWHNRG